MKKFTLLMIAIAFSAFAFAQTDFSGTWALNNSKSELGEMSFAPSKLVIKQSGNEMTVEQTMDMMGQTNTSTTKYTLDGKESTNEGFGGNASKSTATWSADKKALTVVTKIDMQGNAFEIKAVYKMDGSNLVIENSMGDFGSTKQVFDKQ
ncbi:MAG: hypothetical protein JXR61_11000 [Prolixibacteraceae bacterium]|nr:hypothetical protein [Prolixibacteraceae bacterium]